MSSAYYGGIAGDIADAGAALIAAAQEHDYANRGTGPWQRVPDDQAARLIEGAFAAAPRVTVTFPGGHEVTVPGSECHQPEGGGWVVTLAGMEVATFTSPVTQIRSGS